MTVFNITVKWNGRKYPLSVETDPGNTGIMLKSQLFSLTGVEPDRQKIMVKGGMLKDETELSTLALKEGQQLLMMGTVGDLPKPPPQQTVFVEDMTSAQLAQTLSIPSGLTNLGNTCYMNATVQCLRKMPELFTAIEKMKLNISNDRYSNLAVSLGALVNDLKRGSDAVPPLVFLQVLRSVFPQFAEQDNRGYMQQDAEECWGQVVHALSEKVPGLKANGDLDPDSRFVEQFMTAHTRVITKCDDNPQEESTTSLETLNKLRVIIGSGVSTYMVSDIQAGLTEKIEKNSPSLSRSAIYTKTSLFTRLPKYLTVNFIRFQWKPAERIKAKILKRVQFPHEMDFTNFCTPELQEKMRPAKLRLKEVDDKKAEAKKLKKNGESNGNDKAPKALTFEEQLKIMKDIGLDDAFQTDPGVNPSGVYELVAVLTHVGRAADSGHYIGWTKQDTSSTDWWKFDDDKVSPVTPEDITKLEGGGDWHTAYLVLYRARDLE